MHVGQCAAFGGQAFEAGHHAVGVDGTLDVDSQGFTAVLSMTFKSFSILPSEVLSNWKSKAHTKLGLMGQKAPTAISMPRSGRLRFR